MSGLKICKEPENAGNELFEWIGWISKPTIDKIFQIEAYYITFH